jgi:hypothetical protein
VGILDIGVHKSMLVLLRNNKMDFFREISVGGNDFTKAIIGTIFHEGRAIQFTEEEATEFKFRYGYPLGFSEGMTFHGAPLSEVGAMMRPVVERLSGEIHRSIGFYKDKSASGEVEALYLIGGGSRLKHLSEVLEEKIGIPVSLFPVPEGLRVSGGKKHQENFAKRFSEHAISLSLAMETSLEGNLLPEPYQKIHRMAFVQKGIQYAALGVLVIIALLTLHLQKKVREKKDYVNATQERVSRIQNYAPLFTALQTQKIALYKEIGSLNLHLQQDDFLIQMLRLVSHSVPKTLSLTTVEYGKERTLERKGRKYVEQEGSNWILRIRGMSENPPNDVGIYLAQLIVALEKSKYFSDVKLVEDMFSDEEDQQKVYEFELIGYVNNGKEEGEEVE